MIQFLEFLWELILAGLIFLRDYAFYPTADGSFSLMRIFSLLIAFSISGAIVVFLSQGAILKHLGPTSNKLRAYSVASVSGIVLAVCSCSVLPMFASIRKKGAGLGPAVTFLFSGPALNVLALTLTFSDLGRGIAIARVIGAITLSIIIGLILFLVFRKHETIDANQSMFEQQNIDDTSQPFWQRGLFFITLIGILVFGVYRPLPTIALIVFLIVQLILYFDKSQILEWLTETLSLAKRILPLFVIGIFAAGMIYTLVTEDLLVQYVGSNTYGTNALASMFGALFYFATLTEVPIVKALLDNGMHLGPATALLLAGPSLSIPNMIVITKVIGWRRGFTYFTLVIMLSAFAGLIAGFILI